MRVLDNCPVLEHLPIVARNAPLAPECPQLLGMQKREFPSNISITRVKCDVMFTHKAALSLSPWQLTEVVNVLFSFLQWSSTNVYVKYLLAVVHFSATLFFSTHVQEDKWCVWYLLPPYTWLCLLVVLLIPKIVYIKTLACTSCEQACTALITAMDQQKSRLAPVCCWTLLALHISSAVSSADDMIYPICVIFYFQCSIALHIQIFLLLFVFFFFYT